MTTAGPNLLVANDSFPIILYHNNRKRTFTDAGMLTGAALSGEGMQLGNMGVDWGDYDHSGRLSFFVTHFEDQPNSLYRNMGPKGFDDVSWTSGVGQPAIPASAGAPPSRYGQRLLARPLRGQRPRVSPDRSARNRRPLQRTHASPPQQRDGTFDEVSKQAACKPFPLQSRRWCGIRRCLNTGNIDVEC